MWGRSLSLFHKSFVWQKMDPLHLIEADACETGYFAFDFETESETGRPADAKNPWLAKPTVLALASPNRAGAFSIDDEQLIETFQRLATNPKLFGIAHNAPFDVIVGHRADMVRYEDWQARCLDSLGYAWAVDEERPKGLKMLAKRYLNKTMVTYEEAAISNPILREIDLLNTRLAMHRENRDLWAVDDPRKVRRPYPSFDDPAMHWNSIKKHELKRRGVDKPDDALNEQLTRWREDLFDEFERWKHADYVEAFEARAEAQLSELRRRALKTLKEYARDDARFLFPLMRKLLRQVKKEGAHRWMEIEMDVRWQTIGMEICGMAIDRPELAARGEIIKPLVEEFRAECYNLARQEFNPNSPPQLCELIFYTMRLVPPIFRWVWVNGERVPIPKLTDGGFKWCLENGYIVRDPANGRTRWVNCIVDLRKPDDIPDEVRKEFISTDTTTLSRLGHPIGQAILNFRTVSKLLSTYVEGMGEKVDASGDSQVHGRFNSFGTDTGRFSSSNPNLQNIPSRKKPAHFDERIQGLGPAQGEVFVPPPPDSYAPEGYALIVSDQSQIELRVIAHFSGDFNLRNVYSEQVTSHGLVFFTGDVHAKTSASLGIPRKPSKSVNFGFNYGMGPEKFARMVPLIDEAGQYDIPKATAWRDGFFQTYNGLHSFLDELRTAWDGGQRSFLMISGRHRHFNDDNIMPGKILNAKVQGSSADMIKANMFIVRKYVMPKYLGLRPIGQVHDELIYACPKRFVQEAAMLIKYVMEYDWFGLSVPILADTTICDKHWAQEGDDRVPPVGTFFARVDDEDRLFTAENWLEYVDADDAGRVSRKSSCARLLPDETDWCKTIVPDRGPLIQQPATARVMTRDEEIAMRN